MSESVAVHPVQTADHKGGKISTAVTLRAYEVYRIVHGPQPALIEGGCRGGFGTGELIAYLYAYGFPRNEWRARIDEALIGMKHI